MLLTLCPLPEPRSQALGCLPKVNQNITYLQHPTKCSRGSLFEFCTGCWTPGRRTASKNKIKYVTKTGYFYFSYMRILFAQWSQVNVRKKTFWRREGTFDTSVNQKVEVRSGDVQ